MLVSDLGTTSATLQWYLSPEQWATDIVTMNGLINDVFGESSDDSSLAAPALLTTPITVTVM